MISEANFFDDKPFTRHAIIGGGLGLSAGAALYFLNIAQQNMQDRKRREDDKRRRKLEIEIPHKEAEFFKSLNNDTEKTAGLGWAIALQYGLPAAIGIGALTFGGWRLAREGGNWDKSKDQYKRIMGTGLGISGGLYGAKRIADTMNLHDLKKREEEERRRLFDAMVNKPKVANENEGDQSTITSDAIALWLALTTLGTGAVAYGTKRILDSVDPVIEYPRHKYPPRIKIKTHQELDKSDADKEVKDAPKTAVAIEMANISDSKVMDSEDVKAKLKSSGQTKESLCKLAEEDLPSLLEFLISNHDVSKVIIKSAKELHPGYALFME